MSCTNVSGVAVPSDSVSVPIEKFLRNRQVTNRTTGKLEQYDDTNTSIEYEADIWEDEAGTVPYDGDAAILRRDRLEET